MRYLSIDSLKESKNESLFPIAAIVVTVVTVVMSSGEWGFFDLVILFVLVFLGLHLLENKIFSLKDEAGRRKLYFWSVFFGFLTTLLVTGFASVLVGVSEQYCSAFSYLVAPRIFVEICSASFFVQPTYKNIYSVHVFLQAVTFLFTTFLWAVILITKK